MYFFIKTLHLLGVALLTGALLGQGFLYSRKNKMSAEVMQDLRRWTAVVCLVGLLLVVITGLQMGLSTGLFFSEDDLWLLYKSGLFIIFFPLILWQQYRLHQKKHSPKAKNPIALKKGIGALVILLFCVSLYISVAKPYIFNNPSIVFETIESAADTDGVEEIEEVEE